MSARGSYYVGTCLISSRGKGGSCRPSGASAPPPTSEGKGGEKQNSRNPVNCECLRSEGDWAGGVPLISVARGSNFCPRLALRGAPLILTSRGKGGGASGGRQAPPDAPGRRRPSVKEAQTAYRGSDTVSVVSDEGSSSVNSESGLPRIIKPRKRRKKERRPAKAREDAVAETAQPSPRGAIVDEVGPEVSSEAVETLKFEEDALISLCHCRLCDPTGFIWGVDRSCYSSFPPRPLFSSYRPIPAPYVSEPLGRVAVRDKISAQLNSVGGSGKSESDIEERGRWSSTGRNLEVSSEIITSPNGHRDLEIKFFSTTSKTSSVEDKESDSPLCSWNSYQLNAVEE